ncbi:MAG: T9SS type A sorting domain-containing protein [bacterium]
MLEGPKACNLQGPLSAWLFFLVLLADQLFGQFVTVVDGYDVSQYDSGAPILSFSPFAAYPNPFNAGTTFQISPAPPEQLSLVICNALGQQMRAFDIILNGFETQKIAWDGRDANGQAVASGIYIVKLRTAKQSFSKKLLLLR